MIEFLIILAFIWLIIASYSDFKKNEVANWLNFSLVVFALSYRLIYSALNSDYNFFLFGLIGFAVFFLVAEIFYYSRIFAGGDAKLLMALGAVLPLSNSLYNNLIILAVFIFLSLFTGSIYGLIYSFFLVLNNRKNFSREFYKQLNSRKNLIFISLPFALLFFIFVLYLSNFVLILLPLIILAFPFLLIYTKSVEESCMIKEIKGKDVTVGDWLYQTVTAGNKKIEPYWEGLDEEEVKLIKKSRKKIKIKYGIPFTPAFLMAFILLLYLWYSSWSFFQLF